MRQLRVLRAALCAAATAVCLLGSVPASAQRYRDIIKDAHIVEVRGETADTTKLGSDRYVEDNIDYLLANNDWLAVNFSTYWCPDSRAFRPGYNSAATIPKYKGIRWTYAEIAGETQPGARRGGRHISPPRRTCMSTAHGRDARATGPANPISGIDFSGSQTHISMRKVAIWCEYFPPTMKSWINHYPTRRLARRGGTECYAES